MSLARSDVDEETPHSLTDLDTITEHGPALTRALLRTPEDSWPTSTASPSIAAGGNDKSV
eukprot:2660653-Heterocapsa_arctica.AAC.1